MASAAPAGGGAAVAAAVAAAAVAAAAALYAQLGARAKETMNYFTQQHRFRFIRSLHSAGGGALLCDELANDNNNTVLRRLVIKHALNHYIDECVENEIEMLEQLRGSEHIVQVIDFPDPNFDARPAGSALRRPYFVMEYVAGGTIRNWVGQQISEEALWSIFLCLTRSCIAMAYPRNGRPNGRVRKERIPGVGRPPPPLGMAHNDLHSDNVVVGDYNPRDFEHTAAPLIKLIDFGLATIEANGAEGVQKNIYDIGLIMLSLARGRDFSQEPVDFDSRPVFRRSIRISDEQPPPMRIVDSHAVPSFGNNAALSRDFREAVTLCLAVDEDERPSLSSLNVLCTNKTAAGTGTGTRTRRAVTAINRLRFDAVV